MKRESFQTNGVGVTRHPWTKKPKYLDLTPFTKIDSKWIIDFKVKCKTIEHLKENSRRPSGPGLVEWFVGMTPKTLSKRKKNQSIGLHKNFFSMKGPLKRV